MSIYITGDIHRDFFRFLPFIMENSTTKEDTMIILGDAGINYYLGSDDYDLKQELSMYEITFFCIHGNHEERPYNTECNYIEKIWHGGIVYMEEEFPNIIFAKDGEI